jgi:transketolase C-terminal domain/subunit
MSIYVDKHDVKVVGSKYINGKHKKDQVLATHQSSEGVALKRLIPMLEEIADTHDANHEITISITMNQYQR